MGTEERRRALAAVETTMEKSRRRFETAEANRRRLLQLLGEGPGQTVALSKCSFIRHLPSSLCMSTKGSVTETPPIRVRLPAFGQSNPPHRGSPVATSPGPAQVTTGRLADLNARLRRGNDSERTTWSEELNKVKEEDGEYEDK